LTASTAAWSSRAARSAPLLQIPLLLLPPQRSSLFHSQPQQQQVSSWLVDSEDTCKHCSSSHSATCTCDVCTDVQQTPWRNLALVHAWTQTGSRFASCAQFASAVRRGNCTDTIQGAYAHRVTTRDCVIHLFNQSCLPPRLKLHHASDARSPIQVSLLSQHLRQPSLAVSLLPNQLQPARSSVQSSERNRSCAFWTKHMHNAWQQNKQRQQPEASAGQLTLDSR